MKTARTWHITVIDPATLAILFAGRTEDRGELDAVMAEARRLRPSSRIVIRPPMGAQPIVYDPP
jgi:hypothetical protein